MSFRFIFGAARYITGLNQTSVYKVIVISICSELLVSILSISIYYPIQSDIRVKSYCRLNFLRASAFNLERLDILQDSIRHPSKKLLSFEFDTSFRFQFGASLDKLKHSVGHPSKKLLSFEFSKSFRFQFGASRYITGLNRTSVYKVIVISICSELLFSISSVSIYYPIQSDIRVKSYCR